MYFLSIPTIIHSAKKSECLVYECWCISAGGANCSYPDPVSRICDPDECADRDECPGYGYWCDNSGITFNENLMIKEFLVFQLQ